jgi:hypothetical protein
MHAGGESGLEMKSPISESGQNLRMASQAIELARLETARARATSLRKFLACPAVFAFLLAVSWCGRAQAMDTPEADEWDEVCSLGAPTPMLASAAYADYKMKREPYHVLDESASIDAGHRVAIHMSSCADSVYTTVRIDVPNDSAGKHDIDYWAAYARAKILALRMTESEPVPLPTLMKFLSRLPRHPANSHAVSICMDGTRPDDDGCAWRTGGSHEVTMRREGAWMTVTVAEDWSH